MELREDPVGAPAGDERQDDVLVGDREVLSAATSDDELPEGARCALHGGDATFLCARCGDFGCATCMFAKVAKRSVCQTCADKGLGRPVAWEQRKTIGYRRAFMATVGEVSRSPTRFHRTPPTEEGALSALGFGVLSWTVGLALSYLITGILWLIGGGVALTQGPGWEQFGWWVAGGGAGLAIASPFLALFFGPANALLGLVVSSAAAHGTLAIFKRTRHPFEHTFRAICYASAPYTWSFIPLAGTLVYFWVIGNEVIAVRETHGCGTEWAAFAVITYRVLLAVLLVALYTVVIVLGLSLGPRVD